MNVEEERNTQTVNTDNLDDDVPVLRRGLNETPVTDFNAGPFVPRCNPTKEKSSMLSSMYISDDEVKTDDEDDEVVY